MAARTQAPKDTEDSPGTVATTVPGDVAPYSPNLTWDQAVAGADTVSGADLAKDSLLDALVGVPFLVTRLDFRPGIQRPGASYRSAFVSVEAVIAPEYVLRKRRVDLDALPFEPDSQVVFNDGSTGVYRQMVEYLAARGMISLPDGPTEGVMGETVYDLPPGEWAAINTGYADTDDGGFTEYGVDVRLYCPRGLRVSTYDGPTGEARTRYLG